MPHRDQWGLGRGCIFSIQIGQGDQVSQPCAPFGDLFMVARELVPYHRRAEEAKSTGAIGFANAGCAVASDNQADGRGFVDTS